MYTFQPGKFFRRSVGPLSFVLVVISTVALGAPGPDNPVPDEPVKVGKIKFDVPITELESKMTSAVFGNEMVGIVEAGPMSSIKSSDCPEAFPVTEIDRSARNVFEARRIVVAYGVARTKSVTIITEPTVSDQRARLYLYTSRVSNCPGEACTITAKANLLVVPVSANSSDILMSKAEYKNDEVSGELINAAERVTATCKRW